MQLIRFVVHLLQMSMVSTILAAVLRAWMICMKRGRENLDFFEEVIAYYKDSKVVKCYEQGGVCDSDGE